MRIIVALFGSVILPMMTECASIIPEGSENTSRITLSLNEGWSFLLKDVPGEKRGLNDSAWETIDVPHTWNTDDFLDDEYGYYRGIGWYRKEIVLPEYLIGKRLFLYFNGVNQVCDVYVNEQH